MVFKCQEDSFLKEYTSKLVSCEPAKLKLKDCKDLLEGYNVIFEDTIMFPEGGGQPCDYGYLNDFTVRSVTRSGLKAVHFIETKEVPFEIGETVKQKIDWDRRFDHMQQHSGQHLISCLFDREFNIPTKAWWLGSDMCYVELGANDVTGDQMKHIERLCNKIIREAVPVTVTVSKRKEELQNTDEVTRNASKGLPEDSGDIRLISIGEYDRNMCCGTHVTNTSQLQMIKLLNAEKTKQKLFVNFLIGNRISKRLTESFAREWELNLILNGGPAAHIDLIKKLQNNLKMATKSVERSSKELALSEVQVFNALAEKPKYYFIHRTGIEADYLTIFLKEASLGETFLFYTFSDDSGKGKLYIQGPVDDVTSLGSTICELLEGKGNGKNGKFQAKINSTKKLTECESSIKAHFDK